MQFAFHALWHYCAVVAPKYNEANRGPPPPNAHYTSLLTPDDFPKEKERLAILAQKLKEKKARDATKKQNLGEEGTSTPAKKPRKLKKKNSSPPPAVTDDEQDALASAGLEDSIEA